MEPLEQLKAQLCREQAELPSVSYLSCCLQCLTIVERLHEQPKSQLCWQAIKLSHDSFLSPCLQCLRSSWVQGQVMAALTALLRGASPPQA